MFKNRVDCLKILILEELTKDKTNVAIKELIGNYQNEQN